ncbi:hypothetical protein AMAG_11490 [Allomyces macrogynus ATCC 38327]|uniref:Uncharacterized protein n=1 Tax=Allomyces macrogynus (strain ATCC 38327) TaxID=578462 RepID=A0A0L0SV04_ALLM3|nr:hypothetical protein AMAG_11490 [Allomyces macrogynus ATCC 38327]|eukprot:KNE66347.1 hypothetical protein AMAG_11490 [Allomyces macrogynus ATCC 38327]
MPTAEGKGRLPARKIPQRASKSKADTAAATATAAASASTPSVSAKTTEAADTVNGAAYRAMDAVQGVAKTAAAKVQLEIQGKTTRSSFKARVAKSRAESPGAGEAFWSGMLALGGVNRNTVGNGADIGEKPMNAELDTIIETDCGENWGDPDERRA